jgi:hypothetical protein
MRPQTTLLRSALILILGSLSTASAQATIQGIYDAGWNSFWRDSSAWHLSLQRIQNLSANPSIAWIQQYSEYQSSTQWLAYDSLPNLQTAQLSEDRRQAMGQLRRALQAQTQVRIWWGLSYHEDRWNTWGNQSASQLDTLTLASERKRALEWLRWHDQKIAKMGGDRGRHGFSVPHEMTRYFWADSAKQAKLVQHFLGPLLDSIQSRGYPVLLSPYLNAQLESPQELSAFWKSLLSQSHGPKGHRIRPNVIVLQDGIGVNHLSLSESGAYYQALHDVLKEHGIEFWINVELFSLAGTGAPAPDSIRVRAQIDSAAKYAQKVVAYDYASLTEDNYAHTMNKLYQQLLQNRITPKLPLRNPSHSELFPITTQSMDALGRKKPAGAGWRIFQNNPQDLNRGLIQVEAKDKTPKSKIKAE